MSSTIQSAFRLALTADFYDESGEPKYADIGLSVFDGHPEVLISTFDEHRAEITPDQLKDYHGVLVMSPRVTARSLEGCENLLAVGRFGVGYDTVDVEACTRQNVLAMITVGAVDRPVAEATIGWMLALTHRLLAKDRLVRTGHWDDRRHFMGCELRDRTLGVIGLGGIGRELVSLLKGFGMRQPMAFDPFAPADAFTASEARSVGIEELLSIADFVSIHCPLNEQTRDLIGRAELALMKSDAYLLNTARGGIVNEEALFEVLQSGRIAGAALDCFDNEPLTEPHRFGTLDNVVLAPHSIAWTEELFRDIGRTACQSMLDVANSRQPHGVINRELLEQPSFQEKWQRLTER